MSSRQREQSYQNHFYQVQNMMTLNTIEADKSLATFSIAALAALAAMNESLFSDYGKLSFLTIFLFIAVITGVTSGYLISNVLLKEAQDRLTKNFQASSKTPLDKGADKLKYGRLSQIMNWFCFGCFLFGIVCFLYLLMIYIKGLPNV